MSLNDEFKKFLVFETYGSSNVNQFDTMEEAVKYASGSVHGDRAMTVLICTPLSVVTAAALPVFVKDLETGEIRPWAGDLAELANVYTFVDEAQKQKA